MPTQPARTRLLAWRKRKGLTQARLAAQIDCDPTQLGRIEGGTRYPGRRLAGAIHRLTGIRPDAWDAPA